MLMPLLGQEMNDSPFALVVYGHFEVKHIVDRLLSEVELLRYSFASPDGFAMTADRRVRWAMVDADRGSAAFIIPSGVADSELKHPLQQLGGGLKVSAGVYGSVDDDVWITLGGAGNRRVIDAKEYLP